jgi:translation elongation factor EF-Tu-like GTPase
MTNPVAIVEFLDATRGGRNTPPLSGFRPQLELAGVHTSCTVESVDGATTFPFGVKHRVTLALLHPSRFPDALEAGMVVRLFEGSKLIGLGEVVG